MISFQSEVAANWNEFGNFSTAPVTLDDHLNYLGSYRRMNFKGLVSLNADNLKVFFWSIIFELACKQRYIFTKEIIEELAMLCIEKTLYHELFHYFTYANRYVVNGFKYNYYKEEAMAVVCFRLLIGFESKSNQAYGSDFLSIGLQLQFMGISLLD